MFPKKCKKGNFESSPYYFSMLFITIPQPKYCIVKIFYKERLALDKMIDEPCIEKKDTVFW